MKRSKGGLLQIIAEISLELRPTKELRWFVQTNPPLFGLTKLKTYGLRKKQCLGPNGVYMILMKIKLSKIRKQIKCDQPTYSNF